MTRLLLLLAMIRLLLLLVLVACVPETTPQVPPPPEYEDVRVDSITANLPGIGKRSWEATEITIDPYEKTMRFFDARSGKAVVIYDSRWVVLREFVRYDKRLKQ